MFYFILSLFALHMRIKNSVLAMNALFVRYFSGTVPFRHFATTLAAGRIGGRRMVRDASAQHQQKTDNSRSTTLEGAMRPNGGGGDAAENVTKALRNVDREADQIQEYFRRRNSMLDPRDQFGSIAANKVHMPQTERIHYGFQPDIWNEGAQIERLLHERHNAVMTDDDYMMDEFAEGFAPQIDEPAKGTCPGLKKHARIRQRRAKRRAMMQAEIQRPVVATDPGCV